MKKIFLSFLIALPLAAQTITPPSAVSPITGTVTLSDYYVLGSDGLLHIASPAQMMAQAQASGVVLTTGSYTDPSWIAGLDWSVLKTSVPTTISGYGITDGVTFTGTGTLTNKSISVTELTGTLTIGQLPALVDAVNVVTGSGTTTATGTLAIVVTGTGSGAATLTYSSGTATVNVPTPTAYTLPTASTGTLGGVMTDGTTTVMSGSVVSVGTITFAQVGSRPTSAAGYGIANGATLDTLAASDPFTAGTNVTITGTWPNITITSSGGVGTVTSVGLAVPSIFSVAGTPITGSGTATITLNSETANTFLAAPNGSSGTPTFRVIASADLPGTIAANTTGNAATATSATSATTAANLSGTPALPNGTTATTQTNGDSTTKLATDAFVLANPAPTAWSLISSVPYTAVGGDHLLVGDVSGTITLPASPTTGMAVCIVDPFGYGVSLSWGLAHFPISVVGNGHQIYAATGGGTASGTVTIARDYDEAFLVYQGAVGNWVMREQHPSIPIAGTLVSGSATATVPSNAVITSVVDTASTPSGPLSVTISGTTATVHGTGSDTFTFFYQ